MLSSYILPKAYEICPCDRNEYSFDEIDIYLAVIFVKSAFYLKN
ncbi:hypothetical protein [Tolypothrix sp. NIES-4075]|nr:hypothetical protein [Tolypothrix sp. NIES-4075]